jgi:hypothetical protein
MINRQYVLTKWLFTVNILYHETSRLTDISPEFLFEITR